MNTGRALEEIRPSGYRIMGMRAALERKSSRAGAE